MKDKKAFVDDQIEQIAESQEISTAEAKREWLKRADHVFNLDKLIPQTHNFIDRGAKFTCENAGHPYHEVWVRR